MYTLSDTIERGWQSVGKTGP